VEIEEAKRRARSGPLLLLARRAFGIAVTFASTVTVARLIDPREYGLANMSVVILAFAQVFREFGLTNAILRKGKIDPAEMSFLFWFNAAATIALAIILGAMAPFAARFYHEPIVEYVIYLSLVGFVIGGLSLQHRALMGRDLRFGSVAMIDSVALAIGFITTLVLAFLWGNVWAIVCGSVAQSISASILYVTRSGWTPGRPQKVENLSELLKFGANASIFSISTFLSNNGASILLGHFLGPVPLGHYNRAQTLYKIPNTNLVQPIAQAVMPLLTRLRPDPVEYRIAYLDLVTKLCTFLFPLSVALTIAAVPLLETLLGARWHNAGVAFAGLAPSLFAVALAYSISDLFITQNRAGELRNLGLIEMVIRLGTIAVCVQFGLFATAVGFTASTILAAVLRMIVAGRKGPVTVRDQLSAALPGVPLAIGAGVGSGAVALASHVTPISTAGLAVCELALGAVFALGGGLCVSSSRRALLSILAIFGADRFVRRLSKRAA